MASEDNGYRSASSRASSPGGAGASRTGRGPWDSDNVGAVDDGSAQAPQSKAKAARKSQGNAAANPGQFGKIRHLKKEDGEPLWRKDIQYDFLRCVFDNDRKVFTNSYELDKVDQKFTFAELYIDTMARSSKTSKVLRDKLLSDHEAAKSMAMVCLLVNVGRMNTTLNFFPEMRAQLRTYHAIPSLQAHQDASAYKQLQDAPRLKSILKGAAEDRPEPQSLAEFKPMPVPRTNPVNLIFLVCQAASNVAELHFPPDGEFHDLIMKTQFTSISRANAFLWLMWFYLESDFTEEGCEENPFGAGVDYGMDVANQGVPRLDPMTEEEAAKENIDPPMEVEFGREKQNHRAKIIAADAVFAQDHQPAKRGHKSKLLGEEGLSAAILPRIRPSKYESDLDSTRSTPPPRALGRLGANSTSRRSGGAPLKYQLYDASSPAGPSPHGMEGILPRKPRPPTAHQLAVERNRTQRVDYILDRGLRKEHHRARKQRRQDGSIIRAKQRLDRMRGGAAFDDSEDDDYAGFQQQQTHLLQQQQQQQQQGDKQLQQQHPFRDIGFGGLCQLAAEPDDFGEQFSAYAAALRRAGRRLARWDRPDHGLGVVAPRKRRRNEEDEEDDASFGGDAPGGGGGGGGAGAAGVGEVGAGGGGGGAGAGDVTMEDAEDLDDVDKELLGLGSPGDDDGDGEGEGDVGGGGLGIGRGMDMGGMKDDVDEDDDDEELDEVDKTLLGIGGDDDDTEASEE